MLIGTGKSPERYTENTRGHQNHRNSTVEREYNHMLVAKQTNLGVSWLIS